MIDDYKKNIVRDYISFSKQSKTQLFVPDQVGNYHIYLYLDQELVAITEFEITD
ncbi:hypothetical protein JCM16358_15380 [Halanaerocella petrolearia]